MAIDEKFKEYKENYFEIAKLEELLHSETDYKIWLKNMTERSDKLQQFFAKNNEIIEYINQYEAVPFDTEEEAMSCYYMIKDLYENTVDDPEFLVPVVRKLIRYFEKKRNIPIVLELYYIAFYEINEMECRKSGASADFTYQLKTLELKRFYRTLDEDKRALFFKVYYHLAVVSLSMNGVSPQESYFWFKEAREFFFSDVVQPIDKDNYRINDEFRHLEYDWISIINYANDLSVEALTDLFTLITDIYESQLENDNKYSVDPYIYGAYLEIERLKRNKTLGAVINEYMEYFRYSYSQLMDKNKEAAFYLLKNTPANIDRWLSKSQDTFFKKKIFDEINDAIVLNWRDFIGKVPSGEVYKMLADWCMLALKYFDNSLDKERAIFELVIKNQVPTYLHSVMVMKLAVEVFEVSYRKKPELFKRLSMNYDELLAYVKKAALFHDIGKIKITDIINRQGRKLSITEFSGIMNHPEFGLDLIKNDIDFKQYLDVIRYHHKSYDGLSGYPFGNQNTKSIYRVIIDLITICDCLDAATDFLGRNYKQAKSFEVVLEELKEGMGTKYNPDFVEIILASSTLRERLKAITNDNRPRAMYDAYLGSLIFNNDNLF